MKILSYIIVGSGHRAMFYARIAKTYPDLFRAIFLCRSQEKVNLMQEKTGIPATTSLEDCKEFKADFIVVAVNKESIADVCEEWVKRGYPVAIETPAGTTIEQLSRLWNLHKQGAKITVFEQYHRYPLLANGLKAIADGKIGTPSSAYLSLAHDYHAASLLKKLLLVNNESFVLRGIKLNNPVVETDSRNGIIDDGRIKSEDRKVICITYSSGKTAIYDFSSIQYRSFIRSRHLNVRGEKGEWNDNIIYYLDEHNNPHRDYLLPDIDPKYQELDTQTLRDIRKTWQSELYLDNIQDEFAITTMLYDMQEYLNNGKEVYPLQEALDDAYFWLLIDKAISSPWQEIKSEVMPWHDLKIICKKGQ